MTIGERLYNLRKEKGLSQEDLANELGVSRQTVSKWETGESSPDFDKIIPLCNYYGITSDELLSGKKDIVEAKKEEKKNNLARNIAISVSLYIISIIMIILFESMFNKPELGVCVFFLFVAVATGLIVYSSIKYSDKEKKEEKVEKKEKNKVVNQVCSIVDIIGVIVYLLVSFATGAWHITWIIFLIMALCEKIVKLIFSIKGEDITDKEEDENE